MWHIAEGYFLGRLMYDVASALLVFGIIGIVAWVSKN